LEYLGRVTTPHRSAHTHKMAWDDSDEEEEVVLAPQKKTNEWSDEEEVESEDEDVKTELETPAITEMGIGNALCPLNHARGSGGPAHLLA